MKGKRTFSILLMLVLLLGGLFGPPLRGRGVSAAPLSGYRVVMSLDFLNAPQNKVCLGSTVYFSIKYVIKTYRNSGGSRMETPIGTQEQYILSATAKKGIVYPSSTQMINLTGSGTIPATFKATELGKATIKIFAKYAEKDISFQVVDCTWKVMIEANENNSANPIQQSIKFQGEGGINVEFNSTAGTSRVTGNGTFRYIMSYTYVNPDPKLKCGDFSVSTGDSTFSITHGTLVGNAVAFGIQLASVKMPVSVVKCEDSYGLTIEVDANPAMTISDPNIPEFNNLVFPDGTSYLPFAFGDGRAGVYLVQRKGK